MPETRRGRGVDYEHRYRSSRWAEDRLVTALRRAHLVPVRLGISGVSRDDRISTRKGDPKVPDLLVFDPNDLRNHERHLLRDLRYDLRSLSADELQSRLYSFVFRKALTAIEVEFSPYRAAEMKDRAWDRKSEAALERRRYKRAKPPTAPNIFIKREDLAPLRAWERAARVPVTVVHVFDQEAFAIQLRVVASVCRRLDRQSESDGVQTQLGSGVFMALQSYDRSDAQGAAERKYVFRVAPCAAVFAGKVTGVRVEAQLGLSTSKKYVASVVFRGGTIRLSPAFLKLLRGLRA